MKCFDCPQLDGGRMPADWKPRAECCLDAHRKADLDQAKRREAELQRRMGPEPATLNRQRRRALARAQQKIGRSGTP